MLVVWLETLAQDRKVTLLIVKNNILNEEAIKKEKRCYLFF
jgi:hypothetical protein